jgi:hypothetical protein
VLDQNGGPTVTDPLTTLGFPAMALFCAPALGRTRNGAGADGLRGTRATTPENIGFSSFVLRGRVSPLHALDRIFTPCGTGMASMVLRL